MKTAIHCNRLPLLVCFSVFAWAILTTSANGASAQGPARDYWVGLARYLVDRGYVAAAAPTIDRGDVEICYKAEPMPISKELGSTIDIRFAIPAWGMEGKLRKANYKIEEIGEWVRNKTFSLGWAGVLRSKVDSSWTVVHTDTDEIYKAKLASARPLSLEIKETIIGHLVHHTVGPFELANYRFSALEPFENRLWIYDTATGTLFNVSADGDLDSLATIRRGLPDYNTYDRHKTDLADGPLLRTVVHENVVWLHGLWAALGGEN